MKYALALSALAAVASAHITVYNIWVNDVDQGLGNSAAGYIRSPPNNNPVKDVTSAALTCNVNNVATAKTVTVAAGDKITFEWHHDTNSASDEIIASSHKGPVMVYAAPTSSNGAGDVWVKLFEQGYDATTKTWAVDDLITNKGKHSITLPSTLAAGDYLLRPEILALQEADTAYNVNSARGTQFYMECVQITVTGSGATTLPAGVAIPGAYSYSDPGVVFNLYGSFTEYTIPGPAVWDGATSGSTSPVASSAAPSVAATSAIASSAASIAVSAAGIATSAVEIPVVATSTPASSKSVCKAKTSSATTLPTVVKTSSAAPLATIKTSSATTLSTIVKTSSATTPSTVVKASSIATRFGAVATSYATLSAFGTGYSAKASGTGAVPSAIASAAAGTIALYQQCGGSEYTGATTCTTGAICQAQNPYYSQCIASS